MRLASSHSATPSVLTRWGVGTVAVGGAVLVGMFGWQTANAAGIGASDVQVLAVAAAPVPAAAPQPAVGQVVIKRLPPGGASNNTEGTTSSVSPGSVAVGGTLSFSVTGYPAGETAYVKIDDGQYTGDAVIQGADVVAAVPIGADGVASGSLTIPADLAPGEHWLRVLASTRPATGSGVLGFTHATDTFTVTAAAAPTTSSSVAPTTSSSVAPAPSQSSSSSSSRPSGSSSSAAPSASSVTTAPLSPGSRTTTTSAPAASGGSSGTPTSGQQLASTGPTEDAALAIGGGLLLAGLGLTIAGQRRRSSAS
ncbi:LPXTG cell wall anchor domain-containing protein [Nakamurella leprariae]|uniref:LPXTG cell wall anchor domain-containing protein n=1 Tax=Nakamurella leprariae TaxID=2803911 RepID=A0A938YBC8_9ACTN|nr:LPXTG cell wall anchor domain-containing protein [Nakamurella leprariae]MBM9469365.1 LPXTG cell wall anchor domain-containing protein [Nakamurella leprariae]